MFYCPERPAVRGLASGQAGFRGSGRGGVVDVPDTDGAIFCDGAFSGPFLRDGNYERSRGQQPGCDEVLQGDPVDTFLAFGF